MQDVCPSRIVCTTASSWTVPRPVPRTEALFNNTNRDSSVFLHAAGIKKDSQQHKELKSTLQALHRRHMHPFKYLEEQAPERLDQLIAKACLSLPWLSKYEDAWPARIYLKRYVDIKRPHLMCSRHHFKRQKQKKKQKQNSDSKSQSQTSHKQRTKDSKVPNDMLKKHEFTVMEFLRSLTPSLEHHLDAFIDLGINDQKTLVAFLSWPQIVQAQFLDENRGVLDLTSLERKGLLVSCGQLLHKIFQESLPAVATSGCFL